MCVLYYKSETFCFSMENSLTGERERERKGGLVEGLERGRGYARSVRVGGAVRWCIIYAVFERIV